LQNGFIALQDGRIVGFSHYKHLKESTAKTTLMTVLPEYRRNGLGEKLQLARMKEAHEKGYKKLITFCETPKTIDWYVKHFNYKILRTEPVHHRLHFIQIKDQTIWAVHYGSKKQKHLQILVCNLEDYFK
jgi:N-acetylglutamate synthase-like GNAT family acetyltransferase